MEIWKDIKGFEGKYQVSNYGNVKSLNYNRTGKERLLKQNIDKYSYHNIHLYSYGKDKRFLIHRIVAEAFIPNPDNLPYVNHKDENKKNNCADNLEWCDNWYNAHYGTHLERARKANECCPTTSKPVYSINEKGEKEFFLSIGEAERRTGILHGNIVKVLKGKRKKAGGRYWHYC